MEPRSHCTEWGCSDFSRGSDNFGGMSRSIAIKKVGFKCLTTEASLHMPFPHAVHRCPRAVTVNDYALYKSTHSLTLLHPQTPFDVQLKGATGFSISGTHYVRQRFQAVSDNRSDHPPRRQLAKSATASAGGRLLKIHV